MSLLIIGAIFAFVWEHSGNILKQKEQMLVSWPMALTTAYIDIVILLRVSLSLLHPWSSCDVDVRQVYQSSKGKQ